MRGRLRGSFCACPRVCHRRTRSRQAPRDSFARACWHTRLRWSELRSCRSRCQPVLLARPTTDTSFPPTSRARRYSRWSTRPTTSTADEMKSGLFSFLLMWAFVPLASAQEASPDALVKGLSEDVIAAIRRDKDIQAGDADKISALVEAKILPHFDFRRTTQVAMGVNWRRASPDQQERLTSEFKLLLVRTYSGALASYRDQTIEFKPLRASPGDPEVTVRSQVRQSGAEPLTIDYAMEKTASGWIVFDVTIGGISLAANYRTAFGEEVRNHGIDGLITLLADKNRQAAAKPRRAATLAGSS